MRRSVDSIRFRVERRRWERQNAAAWRGLKRAGGSTAASALEAGFVLADQYRAWDSWSLDRTSIIWLAELLLQQEIKHIIEFGAGFSTLALAGYLRQMLPETSLMSFEHQPDYARRIQSFLPVDSQARVECAELWQVDDLVFERLFTVPAPYSAFKAAATPVPVERYHETRLHNVFYEFDFEKIAAGTVDLIILDGPNGNGRSLAFPFLRHALRLPGWLLIDDYLDYPFLDHCRKVFAADVIRHFEGGCKTYMLVRVVSHI